MPDNRDRWTPEDDAKLARMRADGATAARIAEALGRTRAAVESRIAKALRTGKLGRVKIRNHPEVVHKMSLAGYLDADISRALGTARSGVSAMRRSLGLPRADRFDRIDRANEARMQLQRDESERLGWPPVTRGVRRVLEAAEKAGPAATMMEIARAGGYRARGRNTFVHQQAWISAILYGHVVRVGKRGRAYVYNLAGDVVDRRARHLEKDHARTDRGPQG